MKQGDIIEKPCPKCESDEGSRFLKKWEITSPKGSVKTRIEQFKCIACRRKWRRGVLIEKHPKKKTAISGGKNK